MIFAEALPDPNSYAAIGWFVVIIAAIAFGLNQGLELVGRARGKAQQPPNGELSQNLKQLNHRVRQIEDWRDGLLNKLDDDKEEIKASGEARCQRIEAHVEDVRRELDAKLSAMPSEIITLLRNTGALR